jgi:hypothetical protein
MTLLADRGSATFPSFGRAATISQWEEQIAMFRSFDPELTSHAGSCVFHSCSPSPSIIHLITTSLSFLTSRASFSRFCASIDP